MHTRVRLAAACVLLAVLSLIAACGLNAAGEAADPASSSAAPSGSGAAPASPTAPAFGRPYAYPDGLSVTVSRPKAFTPSSTATPRVDHAVSFEITVLNGSDRPYQLSAITLSAAVNGEPSQELIDSAQGYTGLADANTDVPPSRKLTLLLAFGSADAPSTASLSVKPQPEADEAAEFTGPVSG